MSGPFCRLLPYAVADGPHHMAADEVLLEAAAAGTASLRFYGWAQATLSLGYFQPARLRQQDEHVAALPYVRRPSGGAALVHHYEVTYALGLPAGLPWQTGQSWLCRMHTVIAAALAELGIAAQRYSGPQAETSGGLLCFRHRTPGDLVIGPAKVVGSAQRRQRGALMQHGAILLASSPYTPMLPGIQELCGRYLTAEEVCSAVASAFARQTGWDLATADWTGAERRRIDELAAGKYARDSWNHKR